MLRTLLTFCISSQLLAASFVYAESADAPTQGITYELSQTFKIGGAGGWDYLYIDPATKRLYVPRTTHTMVVDATDGKVLGDIPGQKHNHGVAIVPTLGRGFITDDDSVDIFDLKTFGMLGKIKVAEDADGCLYDPESNKILVGCGDAGVMFAISPDIDPKTGTAGTAIELGGKPESAAAGNGKIYVNLVNRSTVAVIDSKTMKVEHQWPVKPGGGPAGMAMDTAHHHLFVGCRKPAKMIVMDSEDGKVLADLPIGEGVDFGGFAGDAYASCRVGTLTVVRETSPGKFEVAQTVKTQAGSRTMCVDPTTHTVYLPAAKMTAGRSGGRPQPVAGSFEILVVSPKK
jgi:DNA-binding beta-propeller fold protein YncE